MWIRRFNGQELLRKPHTNLLVIDSRLGSQEKDEMDGSSYNEANVQIVVALVKKLLGKRRDGNFPFQPDHFCILTFYSAQEKLHRRAMATLDKQKPGLGAGSVKIATVDRYQGHESDVVILDMVVVDRLGFLSEAGRLNSALTRAKHGLYVVASCKEILDACGGGRGGRYAFLRSIITQWKARKVVCEPEFISTHLEAWRARNRAR